MAENTEEMDVEILEEIQGKDIYAKKQCIEVLLQTTSVLRTQITRCEYLAKADQNGLEMLQKERQSAVRKFLETMVVEISDNVKDFNESSSKDICNVSLIVLC